MSQPVKLSDTLILDARLAGNVMERSIAGQVEFWAGLGRSIEPLLQGDRAMALCRSGKQRSVSECLEGVDTPKGRARVQSYLAGVPFPHYEADPKHPGLLVRIEKSGRRTTGRFVNRTFQTVNPRSKSATR